MFAPDVPRNEDVFDDSLNSFFLSVSRFTRSLREVGIKLELFIEKGKNQSGESQYDVSDVSLSSIWSSKKRAMYLQLAKTNAEVKVNGRFYGIGRSQRLYSVIALGLLCANTNNACEYHSRLQHNFSAAWHCKKLAKTKAEESRKQSVSILWCVVTCARRCNGDVNAHYHTSACVRQTDSRSTSKAETLRH